MGKHAGLTAEWLKVNNSLIMSIFHIFQLMMCTTKTGDTTSYYQLTGSKV